LRGDETKARVEFEKARNVFALAAKESPNVPEPHAFFGWSCALVGRKDEAIAEGVRAVQLRPESQDALDGTILNAILAMIYARVGEKERALTLLEHLSAVPGAVDSANYSVSINDLKHRWEWDPLRSEARFQKLIGEGKP
jgi:Flp pilus assembly protein TadD